MKTRAPELSALIIILRSTGPVISHAPVLRGARATGATLPVALAHAPRLREEVGQLAGRDPLLARRPRRQQLGAPRAELALQRRDELERVRRQQSRRHGLRRFPEPRHGPRRPRR